jgi:nucleoside-diphosphate-sugar epimerase
MDPITQYSKIKCEIEHYLNILTKEQTHDITIFRPATLYGVSPRQRLDLMLNVFADKVVKKAPITIYGGLQSRPVLHVSDMAKTIYDVIQDERSYGEAYNVSKEAMAVLEYSHIFKSEYPDIQIMVENTNDTRSYRVDSEKIYRDLDVVFRTELVQGIKDLVQSFRDNPVNRDYAINIDVVKEILCR